MTPIILLMQSIQTRAFVNSVVNTHNDFFLATLFIAFQEITMQVLPSLNLFRGLLKRY